MILIEARVAEMTTRRPGPPWLPVRQEELVPPGATNHPADLDGAAAHDVEDQVVAHDEQPVPQASKACVSRLPTGLRKPREAADRPVHAVHERSGGGGVVPGDVVEDVEEVLFGGRKILETIPAAHGARARNLRIISPCPIPFVPLAACASASSSFRYNSNCACRRS